MPKHPSLEEVLEAESGYEWMDVNVSGFFLGDFADSENGKGDVTSPSFSLFASSSQSEYDTYSFSDATISVYLCSKEDIENLNGKTPLGAINYYEEDRTFISINLTPEIYNNLLVLLCHNLENLTIKIAVPIWHDKEAKSLPLIKYQVMYKEVNEYGAEEI